MIDSRERTVSQPVLLVPTALNSQAAFQPQRTSLSAISLPIDLFRMISVRTSPDDLSYGKGRVCVRVVSLTREASSSWLLQHVEW